MTQILVVFRDATLIDGRRAHHGWYSIWRALEPRPLSTKDDGLGDPKVKLLSMQRIVWGYKIEARVEDEPC